MGAVGAEIKWCFTRGIIGTGFQGRLVILVSGSVLCFKLFLDYESEAINCKYIFTFFVKIYITTKCIM